MLQAVAALLMVVATVGLASCADDGSWLEGSPGGYIDEQGRPCDLTPGIAPPPGYVLDTLAELENINHQRLVFSDSARGYLLSLRLVSSAQGRTVVSRTDDGGRTWRRLPLSSGSDPTEITCFGRDTCMITVRTRGEELKGYRTFDGGETWTPIVVPGLVGNIMEQQYTPSGRLYAIAGTGRFSVVGTLIRSDDHGSTWRQLNDGPEIRQISHVPGAPDLLYALTPEGTFVALDTSGIVSYQWPVTNKVSSSYIGLQALNRERILIREANDTYLSADGGRQWRRVAEDVEGVVGFESPERGIFVTRQRLCIDYDVFLSRDVFAVTEDFGVTWTKAEVEATNLGGSLRNCHHLGGGEWRCLLSGRIVGLRRR